MSDVFPPRVLPGRGEEWGRVVETRIEAGEKSEVQLEQKVDNGLRATSGQLAVLADQVSDMSEILALLSNAAEIHEDVSPMGAPGAVWYPNPPSVTVTSLSGRFEVSIFGTSAGATSFYSFSAPGYPRTRIQGSTPEAEVSRVSGMGGVSNTSTVYGSWVVSYPPGSTITFQAEALGTTEFSASGALKIQVRPLI